jgi:hypothetical protein
VPASFGASLNEAMMTGRLRFVVPLLCALVIVPGLAGAQTSGRPFEDLQQLLTTGKIVTVVDTNGDEVKGRLVSVRPASITLQSRSTKQNPDGLHTFAAGTVTQVRKPDSLVNGLLIGAAAGTLGAVWFTRHNCGPAGFDSECEAIAWPVALVTFIPGGIAVGGLIDKAIPKVIHVAAGTRRTPAIAAFPWFGKHAGGLAMSVRF